MENDDTPKLKTDTYITHKAPETPFAPHAAHAFDYYKYMIGFDRILFVLILKTEKQKINKNRAQLL